LPYAVAKKSDQKHKCTSLQKEFIAILILSGMPSAACCYSFRCRKYVVGCGCVLRRCQHSCFWLGSVEECHIHLWRGLLSLRVSPVTSRIERHLHPTAAGAQKP